MAAGIRTLPTPTPLETVWPQKRDPLLEQIVLGLEKITQPTVLALKANWACFDKTDREKGGIG
jgi:hypothetical protein